MELTLSVLRCPDSVVPEQRRVPGGDYRLGRGAECDWVLEDPDRLLSKQHCILEFRSGGWEVRDTSTNGTFVNHASAPIGRDQSAILNDGDRIRLGAYEIEIRVAQAAAGDWGGSAGMPMAQAAPGWETPAPARQEWNAQPAPREVGGAWEASGWEQAAQPTRQQDPMAPRVAGDPFAMPGLDQPSGFGGASPGGSLPGNDPFASPSADPYGSEAMPDHRSSTSDAFLPPRAMQQASGIPDDWDLDLSPKAPVNQGPPPPAPAGPAAAVPDDWDFGDLSPAAAPAPVPPPRPAAPMMAPPAAPPPPAAAAAPMRAPPVAPPPPAPMATPASAAAFRDDFDLAPAPPAFPASPSPAPLPPAAFAPAPNAVAPAMTQFHGDDADPFREDVPVANGGPPPAAPVVVASVPPSAAMAPPPMQPAFVAAPAPAFAPAAPAMAGGGDASAGLAAFLAGAGLGSVPLRASPEETLQSLGAAFAAAIGGMRALLIARADVKREFRIEQTMLRAGANNPVKFSASDEQAIAGMIQLGPQKGVAALAETVADLTAHQVATLAATQAAARALLEKLAPAVVEGADAGGGGLFGGKEKKYWEAYKKLHQVVSDQFDDDFDSAFGKEFARAYEQASKK